MKSIVAALFIFLGSIPAFANASAQQIARAQEVLKRSILPTDLVKMSTEKLATYMKETTFDSLRPRDILRLTEDIKEIYHRPQRAIIFDSSDGFATDKANFTLKKGEIFRIIQRFERNDTSWNNKKDFTGVQGEYLQVLEFTAIKLDSNLEPVGDLFFLVARGGTDRKVPSVERFDGGFMARNPSLAFSRAGVNDLIVNAQEVMALNKLKIPAFTPAIVLKIERTRIPWTISNYDYVFTLHLLNCPEQFQAQKCETQIKGTKAYPDPIWAHYTMPENRRIIKFWGGELHY